MERAIPLTPTGLDARPELYGLAAFARTLGSARRLLRVRVQKPSDANFAAWAVDAGAGRRLLLIDKGRTADEVVVASGGRGTATVERLLAASPRAESGVTLEGQAIGRDGRWHGPKALSAIRARARSVSVRVPGFSAAIVTVP